MAFQSFHVGQVIKSELAVPFDKSGSHPAALKTSQYGASMKELLKPNINRDTFLMKRNSFVYIFRATQVTILKGKINKSSTLIDFIVIEKY